MIIVHSGPPPEYLFSFQRLAECVGIRGELVDVRDQHAFMSAVDEAMAHGMTGLVLDIKSIAGGLGKRAADELATYLQYRDVSVLLLATGAEEACRPTLRKLTNGAVLSVDVVNVAHNACFAAAADGLSGELSSQCYIRKQSEALGLSLGSEIGCDVVMRLDRVPSFARARLGKARVFVWSTVRIFDMSRPIAAEKEFEDAVDEYVPAIIFLRFAFGARCWHNPRSAAGIIIDDPLLKRRYGFIDFAQLLASARAHGYHITLAFIPWNHWRSRAREARLFLNYADCFSICVHGCDHTKNEYGSADYATLLSKNHAVRSRMQRHHRRIGLASEPLMVCPQEQYSLEAMRAFADGRQFLGLANSSCIPRNLPVPQVCGADLLLPAQDRFFGFPIFKRHYWKDMSPFSMQLFLGKPAILSEHHEFFRNGLGGVEEFAARVGEIRRDVCWTPISETAIRTHLRRWISRDRREVRFFTDIFLLEHKETRPIRYRLLRRLPDPTVVESVRVNGYSVPFLRRDDYLEVEVQAEKSTTLQVQVIAPGTTPAKAFSGGIGYRVSVGLRRGLSELRDNLLSRNRFALHAFKSLTDVLNQRGGQ